MKAADRRGDERRARSEHRGGRDAAGERDVAHRVAVTRDVEGRAVAERDRRCAVDRDAVIADRAERKRAERDLERSVARGVSHREVRCDVRADVERTGARKAVRETPRAPAVLDGGHRGSAGDQNAARDDLGERRERRRGGERRRRDEACARAGRDERRRPAIDVEHRAIRPPEEVPAARRGEWVNPAEAARDRDAPGRHARAGSRSSWESEARIDAAEVGEARHEADELRDVDGSRMKRDHAVAIGPDRARDVVEIFAFVNHRDVDDRAVSAAALGRGSARCPRDDLIERAPGADAGDDDDARADDDVGLGEPRAKIRRGGEGARASPRVVRDLEIDVDRALAVELRLHSRSAASARWTARAIATAFGPSPWTQIVSTPSLARRTACAAATAGSPIDAPACARGTSVPSGR